MRVQARERACATAAVILPAKPLDHRLLWPSLWVTVKKDSSVRSEASVSTHCRSGHGCGSQPALDLQIMLEVASGEDCYRSIAFWWVTEDADREGGFRWCVIH